MVDSFDGRIEVRVPIELKRKAEDSKLNISAVCRMALEKECGMEEKNLQEMMREEEELFGDWANSFIVLYQYIHAKLADRSALLIVEETKLREVWARVEERMKSREQLMEDIPELKELQYIDCFNWSKVFKIIEKYPQSLQGKLGLVQIREGILYREVKAGNFKTIQEARDKMRAEIDLRVEMVKKELTERVNSKEFEREYLIKQEELRIEEERKRNNGGN